ncbi:hypothetical protein L6164_017649 [Bauhinia variegata]|uniref:Uncharacterized protein n=1 Tax=Bauhinia variegata TaxID=167791 RepID=A0ACB9N8T2_BAUVA|nr:hypothetical protein L6164_017649 [Bauhinia variegata]
MSIIYSAELLVKMRSVMEMFNVIRRVMTLHGVPSADHFRVPQISCFKITIAVYWSRITEDLEDVETGLKLCTADTLASGVYWGIIEVENTNSWVENLKGRIKRGSFQYDEAERRKEMAKNSLERYTSIMSDGPVINLRGKTLLQIYTRCRPCILKSLVTPCQPESQLKFINRGLAAV